ncbi:MAG: nucleoside triphosphate pyrophosphohydrolase family protein [Rivularia sp. (in: Bacteria)]|nr:nucleoside triphosphate pyrophosphohydrolase family protein [Rivularia sp. MS3]
MDADKYQERVFEFGIYPNKGNNWIYPCIGLAGETGEVSELIKRLIRDGNSILDEESREKLKLELGDVAWYVAVLAKELGLSFNDVLEANIQKLENRRAKGTLKGNGDNR